MIINIENLKSFWKEVKTYVEELVSKKSNWYNIRFKNESTLSTLYAKNFTTADTVNFYNLKVFIENYDEVLKDNEDYKFLIVTYNRGRKYHTKSGKSGGTTSRQWRVPFIHYFNNGFKRIEEANPNINNFSITGELTEFPSNCNIRIRTKVTGGGSGTGYTFDGRTLHKKVGVAIYKNTHAERHPWQRVSNICYIDFKVSNPYIGKNDGKMSVSFKDNG